MVHLFKGHLGEQNTNYLRLWKISTKKDNNKFIYLSISSLVQSRGLNKALPSSWYSTSEKAQQYKIMACSWNYKYSVPLENKVDSWKGKEVVGGRLIQIKIRSQNTFSDR